jgi:hypothetical protein
MTDLERDLRDMMQRTADGVHHVPRPSRGLVRRGHLRRARTAALAGAAAFTLVIGGFAVRSAVQTDAAPVPPADRRGSEIEQMTTIRQVVDAINARDTDSFLDVFTSDGAFSPRGTFPASSGFMSNDHPVADAHLVKAWMAINAAWDLEVDLIACNEIDLQPETRRSDTSDVRVHCELATRWHRLSLEIREGWVFEFDGTKLIWLQLEELLDLNPGERVLPLGYDGLEEWERWLAANHPEDAARYLNPRITAAPDCDGCQQWWDSVGPRLAPLLWDAERNWSINGWEFRPDGLVPYNPKFADEIEASIQAYLDDR